MRQPMDTQGHLDRAIRPTERMSYRWGANGHRGPTSQTEPCDPNVEGSVQAPGLDGGLLSSGGHLSPFSDAFMILGASPMLGRYSVGLFMYALLFIGEGSSFTLP